MTKYEEAQQLVRRSYGLKPKNALDRLLKAEYIFKELNAEQDLQDIQRPIQTYKNILSIL